MNYIISIEGNIGSGKSTLLKNLKTKYKDKIIFIDEPVEDWKQLTDNNNENILELFYKDKNKYSFSFQLFAYITRLKMFINTVSKYSNKIIITERSIFSDKYIFAKLLFEDNYLNSIEWQIYLELFNLFSENYKINKYIYINTHHNECFKRINKRSRSEEVDKISIEYLKKLDKNHLDWLKNTDHLEINGNLPEDNVLNIFDIFINQLIETGI
jgi:deoxyadenosine/deoxycytidine kinase